MKQKFRLRAMTSLMLFWSLILETVSGVILYVVPPGRVAHWIDWKFWGLTKEGWGAVHTIFGYVFLIFGIIHLYLNWKPIMGYIRSKVQAGLRMRAELFVSGILSLVVLAATIAAIPPFGTIMDIGEHFKNSWEKDEIAAFQPHAEDLALSAFADQAGVTLEDGIRLLKQKGIDADDSEEIIKDLAERHGVSPAEIFAILTVGSAEKKSSSAGMGEGRGYGWKTLARVIEEEGLDLETVLKALADAGIRADGSENVRRLAAKHDRSAYELVEMIRKLK